MSLAEASALTNTAPNTIRSRFKAGRIRGERDNAGKIWVWINPDTTPSKSAISKLSIEGSKPFEIEALQAHIQTLSEQLASANAELAILRPSVSEAAALKAEAAGLEAQITLVKEDRDHWRKLTQDVMSRPAKRGFLSLFRNG
jgi:hypothetical protein